MHPRDRPTLGSGHVCAAGCHPVDVPIDDPPRSPQLWTTTPTSAKAPAWRPNASARLAVGRRGSQTSAATRDIALALMRVIAHDEPSTMILNVANGATVPALPADAVVEVPVRVDHAGPRPLPVTPPRPAGTGRW